MHGLHWIDWLVIAVFLGLSMLVGLLFTRRAGKSMAEFFLAGRTMPWWLAGTSMVATTFSADTPLAVTGEVAKHGISGNWLWWNAAIAGMLGVAVFARLWRRAGTLTDLEFIELRYSGKAATVLRGFRAVYEGIFLNAIILGWVLLAITKITSVFFPIGKVETIVVSSLMVLVYAVTSGYWGAVVTDLFQFVVAIFGAIYVGVVGVREAGGIAAIREKLPESVFSFLPTFDAGSIAVLTFIALIGVNWWAGRGADGGGYIAQRVLSTKDERQATLSILWFQIAHFAVRSWPWIAAALASMILFKDLKDPEQGYPLLVARYASTGVCGLIIASFLAAFMSTVDTHLNWGGSYFVNDLYKRFIVRNAGEKHYVLVARLVAVGLLVIGGAVAYCMESIAGAWKFLFELTAGIGGVYILRWFWWRVSAFSEISAWISSGVITIILHLACPDLSFGANLIVTGVGSTALWVIVTLVTPPTSMEQLRTFYLKVRPRSAGWNRVSRDLPGVEAEKGGGAADILEWLLGIVMIYSILFGLGWILLGSYVKGAVVLCAGVGLLARTIVKLK